MGAARNGRVAVLAAAGLALAACRTTHQLGRFGEPETMAALEQAARSRPLQLVIPLEPTYDQESRRYVVTSIGAEGLEYEPTPGEPELMAPGSVRSVSTFAHGRGALEGALLAGPVTGLVSGVLIGLAMAGAERCVDGCDQAYPAFIKGLGIGALIGVGAAAIGAGFGGYYGHEHRYVLAR